jgi:hypothetical protein
MYGRCVLALALAVIAGSAPGWGQTRLSSQDLDQIAAAVLLYDASNSKTYLGANAPDMPLYVSTMGHDIAPGLLKALNATPRWRVFPASEQGNARGMTVGVGGFAADTADTAHGNLGASCGPLCAASETYTVRRTKDGWKVESFTPNWVS